MADRIGVIDKGELILVEEKQRAARTSSAAPRRVSRSPRRWPRCPPHSPTGRWR